MELRPISLDRHDWDALWDATGGGVAVPLQQSGTYGAVAARLGRQVLRTAFHQGGAPVGAAQTLVAPGRFGTWALVGRGPALAPGQCRGQALALIRRALPGRGPRLLVATGPDDARPRATLPLLTPMTEAMWDLSPDPAGLRAGLHQKWRNRLRRAEAGGLHVARARDIAWLIRAEAAQRRARGYRALPPRFLDAWTDLAPKDMITLVARQSGQPVAGMVFLCHGRGATYHLGWSGPEGRAAGAHTLLLWRAALELRARGIRQLNLGALDTINTPGLARFKLGTGARATPLGPTVVSLPGTGRRAGAGLGGLQPLSGAPERPAARG